MLTTFRTRILPFVLVLVAVAVTSAASGFCFIGGFDGASSPSIVAAQTVILALMALVSWAVLARMRKLAPEVMGFEVTPRAAKELPIGFVVGVVCPALVAIALTITHVAPFRMSGAPPSVLILVFALLGFVVNGALQQVQLQSLVVVGSRDGRASVGAIAGAQFVFVGMHAAQHAEPIYVLNVLFFGLLTTLLFFRGGRASYALPIGLHAGWNFAEVCLMGMQMEGVPAHHLGIAEWPANEHFYSGGAMGLEGGIAVIPMFLVLLAIAWRLMRRA
ncbi:MAG TPA: hypothetical protein PK156_35395 [Polyangium sp.]|nr:hypothetical protein [Polyangium sp.]